MTQQQHYSAAIDLGRPRDGDVVDLILDDHRLFEELLRQLRDSSSDRDVVRRGFAALHVAHAEAEEHEVYPTLRNKDAIDQHEEDHGEEEHAEGHEALLAVLEAGDVHSEEFDDLVEKLAEVVNHHLTEEELTILNPAREEVATADRERLGAAFARARNELLDDEDCGSRDQVARIVEEAREKGLLKG